MSCWRKYSMRKSCPRSCGWRRPRTAGGARSGAAQPWHFRAQGSKFFKPVTAARRPDPRLSPAQGECISIGPDRAYAPSMRSQSALPLFHLYGDPPDDQAFDFIHVETIGARAALHDWTILAHRHRSLFQILLIERGGGEMTYETAIRPFEAPAAILVAPRVAHGFRFRPQDTEGRVVSST